MRESAKEGTALFAAFFLLSLTQAAPSVTTGDAGEFAAAAATLGVAHAPGYPLYVLIAKAFGVILPLGTWAYRTNLLSAVCAAAALALFCDALRRFGAGRAARWGAAAVVGLSPLWRELSAVTEVFAPHMLFAALLLWTVAAAGDRLLEPGPSAAMGLIFGLGLGGHQTLALVLPALLLAGRGKPGSLARAIAWAAGGSAAGFLINAALPLRARVFPPLDWDHAADPAALWRLLARRDYGTLSLTTDGGQSSGPEGLAVQAWRALRTLGAQAGPAGAALALLGAAAWRRASLRLPASAVWAWVLCAGPAFLMLGRPPFDAQTSYALERFALLPLLGAGLFVAAGVEVLSRMRPAAGAAAAVAAAAALAPSAAAQSRRGDFLAHDYGRAILRELPPGAVLAMDGGDDTFYSLAFLRLAERRREDVVLFDRGGVVFRGAYGADFLTLPRELKEPRRREVEEGYARAGRLRYSTMNPGLLPGWEARAAGLLRRPTRPGAAFVEGDALLETLPSPREGSGPRGYRDRALAAFFPYQRGVAALERGDTANGVAWMEVADRAGGDALWTAPTISYSLAVNGYEAGKRGDWAASERSYRALAEHDRGNARPLIDLGAVLRNAGKLAEAEVVLREAARRAPREPRAWETLGAVLWSLGRWPECAQAYDSAAALPGADPADARWAAGARAHAGARP